jgi:N-methylhydantoinase B/oxoprolinase/acetone carboxylase alpha subunit
MNSGVLDAVDFIMPAGTLVHPQFPASVNHYFPTSHVVYTCVLAALGKFNLAARSGAGRIWHWGDRDRLHQRAHGKADRAVRADGDVARRHEHP